MNKPIIRSINWEKTGQPLHTPICPQRANLGTAITQLRQHTLSLSTDCEETEKVEVTLITGTEAGNWVNLNLIHLVDHFALDTAGTPHFCHMFFLCTSFQSI